MKCGQCGKTLEDYIMQNSVTGVELTVCTCKDCFQDRFGEWKIKKGE